MKGNFWKEIKKKKERVRDKGLQIVMFFLYIFFLFC